MVMKSLETTKQEKATKQTTKINKTKLEAR